MFTFRLKFNFSENKLSSEKSTVELLSSNNSVYTLQSDRKDTLLKNSKVYIIKGVGFSTEEEAREAGKTAIVALYWFGIKNKLGVNQSLYFVEQIDSPREVVTGVQLVREIVSSIQVNTFIESFQHGMTLELDDTLKLGIDLYNHSHLKSSILGSPIKAKFLSLLFALETQIKEKAISNEKTRQHIDSLINLTKCSDIDEHEKTYLKDRLENLKSESIRYRGKHLMKEHLESRQYHGKSAEKFFDVCYEVRSDIVHGRELPAEIGDLSKITIELDKMVSDFLISCVGQQINQQSDAR